MEQEQKPPLTIPPIEALRSWLTYWHDYAGTNGMRPEQHTLWNMLEYLMEVEQRLAELEHKWQEDHTTLYLLLNQRIGDLQALIGQHEQKEASDGD